MALAIGGIFWLLAVRLGAHWQLHDAEKDMLGEKLGAALASLPKGATPAWLQALLKAIENAAPWLAFGGAVIAVSAPRVAYTRMVQQEPSTGAAS